MAAGNSLMEKVIHGRPGMLASSEAWFRLSNAVMALFFAMASCVQINDPDALLWIVAYALPCFACVSEALRPPWWSSRQLRMRLTGAAILLSCRLLLVSVLSWLRDVTCVGFNPVVCEPGRESGGSAISLAWLLLLRKGGEKVGWKRATLCAVLGLLPLATWTAFLLGDGVRYLCSQHIT
ncbi:transmembrane protein 220-like [Amblyomma americanum]